MAVVVGALSGLEQAAQLAGKPIFLGAGANALRSFLTAAEWSSARTWATGGSGGGTNLTRTAEPTRWAHDARLHARTRPNASGGSSMFLLLELDTATIDTVIIANHNFASIAGCEVRAGVADDSAFSTNLRVIAEWTAFDGSRLVAIDLTDGGAHGAGEYRRFSTVRYAYVEVITSGTFAVTVPRIGEVWMGQRRQLGRHHDRPGDNQALESRTDMMEADSGAVSSYVRHQGRRAVNLSWVSDEADDYGDDVATWRGIFETDTAHGTLPVFYIGDPSAPADAPLLLLNEPAQRFEWLGPQHVRRSFAARELPPFVSGET